MAPRACTKLATGAGPMLRWSLHVGCGLLSWAAANAQALQVQGDWIITNHTVLRGIDVDVNGSVVLGAGGLLEMSDATLQTLCTYDRQFNISWAGGELRSRNVTLGGHLTDGICFHANSYLHDGVWLSQNDTVRCSYGILFAEKTTGTMVARGLVAGPSPDSIIMGGQGNVTLYDSLFSLNLGLPVQPGTSLKLDLPAQVRLTETITPATQTWCLSLHNTASTHWFVELQGIEPVTEGESGASAVAQFVFSGRTSPFNLHLHTESVVGNYSVSMCVWRLQPSCCFDAIKSLSCHCCFERTLTNRVCAGSCASQFKWGM